MRRAPEAPLHDNYLDISDMDRDAVFAALAKDTTLHVDYSSKVDIADRYDLFLIINRLQIRRHHDAASRRIDFGFFVPMAFVAGTMLKQVLAAVTP